MKKILAFVLLILCVFSLVGCMGTGNKVVTPTVTNPSAPASTADEVSYKNYDNNVKGLCEYMADLGYAYDFPATDDEKAVAPIKMDAELIGAEEGYKFTFILNKETYTVEFYEFKDTTGEHYLEAKKNGTITLGEGEVETTVEVTLSKNGKYMFICHCDEDNKDTEAAMIKAFNAFYP